MANVNCILNSSVEVMDAKVTDLDAGPPSKKMKQGRLPFKPLDHAGQTPQGATPPGSKKRKLSENESPSAKQLKTNSCLASPRPNMADGEPEVSSSSEADPAAEILNKQNKKLNTLDKFFKPKSKAHDQEEISSTNDCIEIDLTEEQQEDKDIEKTDSAVVKESENTEEKVVVPENDKEVLNANSDLKNESTEESADSSEEIDKADDKENQSCDDGDVDMDSSFIANTSVCEDALKTPAKDTKSESVLKTPANASSVSSKSTPNQAKTPHSIDSGSDNTTTPVSGKKKSVLSEKKQKERDEMRRKAKEEKERQKEEQRLQKEREKEEKKKEQMEKKRLKEEQKEKERLEREKLKQEEKEKKEQERLEKLKQKEEEKKLKEKENEAKLEEKRKKEEERKQKEEEKKQKEEEKKKEEEDKLRKEEKKKEMFKGFFIKKDPVLSPPKPKETKSGLFMPFELKPNMKLAPERRCEPLSDEARSILDEAITKQDCDQLYLKSVKSSSFAPKQTGKTWPRQLDEDNDVELLSHEKETIEKVTHHVKFLYFHENTRPPYYGTWRKCSNKLSGRNPFRQDETLFDYEVDSDDEWEEEEPGESVSSDEEEDEGEKLEDEDPDADDWMVPHGYLSDDEGIKDEEEDVACKQDLQKVRQAAWESELKRQAKPLKMIAIGCVWESEDMTTIAAQQLQTLLKYKAVCLLEEPIGTSYSGARTSEVDAADKSEDKAAKPNSQRKCVPEEAMPDLIRLLHGNPTSIKKLVREFRMFWKRKTNPTMEVTADSTLDSSKLETSMEVDEKTDVSDTSKVDDSDSPKELNDSKGDDQNEFAISIRQLEKKIPLIASREKRPDNKRLCWYVKDEVLKQYNLSDIKLPNSWEYVCIKAPVWAKEKVPAPKVEDAGASKPATTGRATPNIMQYAKPMSPAQILCQGPVMKDKEPPVPAVPEHATSGIESSADMTPGKLMPPPDQRTIKDMFSPAAKKTINNCLKPKIASPKPMDPPALGQSPNSKSLHSPSTNKIPGRASNTEKPADDKVGNLLECSSVLSGVKTTPKDKGQATLTSMLSSPELMKSNKPCEQVAQSSVDKEQPMEVDIIVLD